MQHDVKIASEPDLWQKKSEQSGQVINKKQWEDNIQAWHEIYIQKDHSFVEDGPEEARLEVGICSRYLLHDRELRQWQWEG